ncbi:formyltransferase family protein [Lachnospiraceae bacterium 38-10]
MILEEFVMLASDTARTKAYLQGMIREKKLPAKCIVYSENISKMKNEADSYKESEEDSKYFDVNIPILFSLDKAAIPYILVENKDINSEQIESVLKGLKQKYLIYSGYGGYILKPHLFRLDKKIIHIHAGILPQYRGSTTVYYSFLQERILGATAILLNEKIDEGEIITKELFEIPADAVNIDYVYEPYIRSEVLLKVIDQYLEWGGMILSQKQDERGAETYFIIHPVLKHLALLKIENNRKR